MNEVEVFNNPEFGEIRTVIIDGEPYFVGNDVAKPLGYSAPKNAVSKFVDDDDKQKHQFDSAGQMREMIVINESGLYSLIFGSKMENAKKFKKWVTSEVLPSIRQTGSYGTPQTLQQQIQTIAKGTDELYQRVDAVESRIVLLEDTMTLDYGQQRFLEKTVSKTVMRFLGGKESNAYRQMGRKVFAECNSDLKDFFKVNARGNIPKKHYESAVTYAEKWQPCTNTLMLIEQHNAQQNFEL